MNILINASTLKNGGGLQVADSICTCLNQYPQHQFIVVLSNHLKHTADKISKYPNVIYTLLFNLDKTTRVLLTGRVKHLDEIIENYNIKAVLTIFGPSYWKPKVFHICGFARAHCVLQNSPFFQNMNKSTLFQYLLKNKMLLLAFKQCADAFYTENEYISKKLRNALGNKMVYTVTNYYNQIFDNPSLWTYDTTLPYFDGTTLLFITVNYPHKNLKILPPTIKYLKTKYPYFKFRFILSINDNQLNINDESIKKHIIFLGKIPLSECPHLYQQCDIVFSSTLLECFSATYPEAMRMGKPIITTDLEVTRSQCGDAALYYDALSAEAFGEAIYKLASNKDLQKDLIEKGKKQLKRYDTYDEHTKKLIGIIESEYNTENNWSHY